MAERRLTPRLDLDGLSPDEAFSVLADETRLSIIQTLWERGAAYEYTDVSPTVATVSFSTLRRAVEVEDNGRFNYHLSKLTPQFVRQTDDGYRLSGAGEKIARTVVAVSGAEVNLTAEIERDCPLCGAALVGTYEDQWLRVKCTACDGLFGEEAPEGMVYFANVPPTGVAERSPDEAMSAGLYRCMIDQAYLMQGLCRECASRIDTTVSICNDHDSAHRSAQARSASTSDRAAGAEDNDGRLADCACGTNFPVWAEARCDSCGFAKRLPVEMFVMGLAPMIGFLNDQGYDVLAPSFDDLVELLETRFETTVLDAHDRSGDGDHEACVRTTALGDSASLEVTLDAAVTPVSIDRRPR